MVDKIIKNMLNIELKVFRHILRKVHHRGREDYVNTFTR